MTKQEKQQKIKEFHVIKQLLYMTYKPQHISVHIKDNDLYLAGTDITSLPEDLYVPGNLYLYSCINLKSLPEDLHVGGCLYLMGCTSLPKDLVLPNVKGKIYR